MATTLLTENNRVFFPSENINIFPCSRRGQYEEKLNEELKLTPAYYDPEARLNTERTNRLHTAINGFKDDFIVSHENKKLIFVLKGYYIEVKDFNPSDIATALSTADTKPKQIYAHLSLHAGISLNVKDYTTEILYRQSTKNTKIKYLDVSYSVVDDRQSINKDFFVGVSFTADQSADDTVTEGGGAVIPYFLPLFSYSTDKEEWQLEQTSLLPKIEHGDSEDLVKIPGSLTVTKHAQFNTLGVTNTITVPNVEAEHIKPIPSLDSNKPNTLTIDATTIDATTINATSIKAKTNTNLDITATNITADTLTTTGKITQNGKSVPAINLQAIPEGSDNPEKYQLQILLDGGQQAISN